MPWWSCPETSAKLACYSPPKLVWKFSFAVIPSKNLDSTWAANMLWPFPVMLMSHGGLVLFCLSESICFIFSPNAFILSSLEQTHLFCPVCVQHIAAQGLPSCIWLLIVLQSLFIFSWISLFLNNTPLWKMHSAGTSLPAVVAVEELKVASNFSPGGNC